MHAFHKIIQNNPHNMKLVPSLLTLPYEASTSILLFLSLSTPFRMIKYVDSHQTSTNGLPVQALVSVSPRTPWLHTPADDQKKARKS